MLNQERIDSLTRTAHLQGIDCVLIVPGANLFYLTGLWMGLSERVTLVGFPWGNDPFAICPLLEAERVALGTGIEHVHTYTDGEDPVAAAAKALSKNAAGSFGVEYGSMRLLEHDTVTKAWSGCTFVDIGSILARQRSIKDAEERALMQKAAVIADAAVQAGMRAVGPGISELEVMHEVERVIKEQRAEGSCAVASGAQSALPHAYSSAKTIQDGDAVWIDLVVVNGSYYADITRTCFVGAPDDRLREVFNIVLEAQTIGRSQAGAGMTGADIDVLCREHIAQAGYGEFFIHRTGHGIGLSVHEAPYIVESNKEAIQPSMTFTIEPGIYLPGTGGVRIEDTVIMTETGVESMTRSERNPIDIPVDR
jgi:Xaa-Pro dipeptidase